jgi:hypothetical protein
MKKTSALISIVVLSLSFIGCAKKNEDRLPAQDPDQILAFQVSNSFQHPVRTSVIVIDVTPTSTHSKKILFRAPRNGTFSLSETNWSDGTACTNPSPTPNGDYDATFEYNLKDPRTGQFNLPPVRGTSNTLVTSLQMNGGDELMVTMKIKGLSTCQMLEIYLSAVFQ